MHTERNTRSSRSRQGIRRSSKKLISVAMALVLTAAYLPLAPCTAFAGDGDNRYAEESVAYLVGEDGTETPISEEELKELRENSLPDYPEEIEVVVNEQDSEEALELDGAYEDFENGSGPDFAADASGGSGDAGTGEEGEVETGEEVEDGEELEDFEEAFEDGDGLDPAGEGIDGEETFLPDGEPAADGNADTEQTPEDTSDWGGGNAEHIDMPALRGKYGKKSGNNLNYATRHALPSTDYNVNITQSGNKVSVVGTIKPAYRFTALYVDLTAVYSLSSTSVNLTVNMSAFSTGYHTVVLLVSSADGSNTPIDLIGRTYLVSNNIVAQPGYKGRFEVYAKYFNFYPYNMLLQNQEGDLYLEYKTPKAKKWSRTGYMRANMIKLYVDQVYRISGLKAKKTYKTRLRYGTYVTYPTGVGGDGQSHFFGGPALKSTTIKTGSASGPKVRSATARAVNVRYHQVVHRGVYTGVYLYTEKFYTCKIQVTVNLKKKPGTKGIFLNGKWMKGNRTSYTKTFSPYPNYYVNHPARGGYKYSVTVCSGQNRSWGGYSPNWSKNVRMS